MDKNKRTVVQKFQETISLLEQYRESVALEGGDNSELIFRIDTSIADMTERMEKQVAKNSTKTEGPSKTAEANMVLADALYEVMEQGINYSATEVGRLGVEGINSTSKATTILKVLVADGRVNKTKIKGASVYTVA